ncbi:Transposase OS=Streptomyces aurantiogriseus OX=66870 GN=GCM10010251_54550 PE=4 SV=1 [Streptomyces aurantiogriseus]|uniref:Uncharacterized protein n=1 Tax=Streptomyces aurantiogriseus TaxID=66870 RepID=A0A918FCU0_9ACTN|nr:hypothetical protein GCM10010251_54550 [Streptomyces aurantiogriseus]
MQIKEVGWDGGAGHYGCQSEQARWAAEQYICRTRGVQARVAVTIKVRNAHEMRLWWDAQVPDRLPWDGGQAA